ncbi:hypothetical protein CLL_A3152 [Clostridium botulinum B str. Eklund 17B (NRP)]|uniref:Uncharacterized protein n=1 Tax=Clostridium botulinum (strain Eklund 17B / Type B) TaxID=935198 RepID=B2TQ81_CLOBB|nr:hypothetical protein CLL_A3152 [Clostridium botulinum B str. Eklund 17B (NRP)]CDH92057.1 hypothetical protein CB17B3068 [Clostridium botulinum B str. Eklund 17B (NRP)]
MNVLFKEYRNKLRMQKKKRIINFLEYVLHTINYSEIVIYRVDLYYLKKKKLI